MPYILVQIAAADDVAEKKTAVIQAMTKALVDVLGRSPESVYVVLQQIPAEDWGVGYSTVAELRATT